MKKILKILSYVLVAVLASVATLAVSCQESSQSKLDQLEALIVERFIGEVDSTAIEDAAADAMVDALGDCWSYYISAANYATHMEQMNNAYVGVGITIQLAEDASGLLVIEVNEGGSAQEAGLMVGDIITAVDGQSMAGADVYTARSLVRGEEGTQVELTVLRDDQTLTFTVTRQTVETPVATAQMLDGQVGLVTIENFDSRCAEETIAAVESLIEQGAVALIFDVRYNPGGYVSQLVEVLDYLLPEGDLFRSVDYAGNETVETSDADCIDLPMAVLVNGSSYSAAEFFAAALEEYGVAVTVGEPTVGKGYFQNTYKLSDGSAVGLSVGKYYTPNGVSLAEAGGLTPSVLVEVDEETAAAIYAGTLDAMEDPQILAAIEALSGNALADAS